MKGIYFFDFTFFFYTVLGINLELFFFSGKAWPSATVSQLLYLIIERTLVGVPNMVLLQSFFWEIP